MMHVLVYFLLCLVFMSGGVLTLGLNEGTSMSSCIEEERQALLDVKASLIDPDGFQDDWGSEGEKMDCCKWSDVICDSVTGHVIKLSIFVRAGEISPSIQVLSQLQYLFMSYINFQSNPLPNFLGSLSNLQNLYISGSNLSGPIPHQLANLSNLLQLDLSHNFLVGPIPHQLANLSNLLELDLSDNFLVGPIPFTSGVLIRLDLSKNKLGGAIPKSFGRSSSLTHLDLSQNLLNWSLPNFVECSSLITLHLANNSLSGNVPDFAGCTSLSILDLSSNFLSGDMPNSVSQLSNLKFLSVNHNSLNGSIPNFIGCHSLSYLDMSSNSFFGNVPNSLGQVSKLTHLDFSSNFLEGVISEVHFLNLTQLSYLDLSFNSLALNLSLNGKIPFQLSTIKLQSCKLGPGFPLWIKTQEKFDYIDISNAGISGSVPDWFWDLPAFLKFLNISSNELEGMIPDIASNFVNYPGMDLSNNHFEGRVPSLTSKSAALNLSGNKFSGTLSFLCNFGMVLTFLDLSDNSFLGSLPDCWMRFQERLVVLSLSNNNLSGEIPSSLGILSNLEALYLRKNAFVGEVPMSLRNCTRLRFVDLGENMLSGVIPEWIGEKLSELYVLILGSNRLYGRLPSRLCWLRNLRVLDLSNNGLSGSIPRCFDNFTAMARRSFRDDMITSHTYLFTISASCGLLSGIPCSLPDDEGQFLDNAWVTWKGTQRLFGRSNLQLLKSIDLSRNKLSGKLPLEITSLYELVSLNLSINKLHGEVPKDMGRLKYLESLDLSRNELFGHIPGSLAQLNFLSYLDLSFNNLLGRIPTGSQLQRFNYTSYTGNPQLCGPPLTPKCGISPVVENKADREDEDDSWKSYYTGMGAGFVVGFLGICGGLILNRYCRYFFFVLLTHIKDWIYVTVVMYFGKLEIKFRR